MPVVSSVDTLKTQKTILFATVEDVEGTYKVPASTEFMRAINLNLSPLVGDSKTHDEQGCGMGSRKKFVSGTHVKLTFDIAVTGAGVAGDKPREDALLRACGRAVTVVAGESASYTPVDDGFESASISVFVDGNKHALSAVKGKVSVKAGGTDFVILSFDLVGMYIDPTQATHPASSCDGLIDPLVQSNALTTWSVDNFSAALYALSVDDGTDPTYKDLPGQAGTTISKREVSGSLEFAAPKLSTKDFFAMAKAGTAVDVKFDHGVDAGHKFAIRCDKVQLLEPNYGDSDGRRSLSVNLNVLPNATNEATYIYS